MCPCLWRRVYVTFCIYFCMSLCDRTVLVAVLVYLLSVFRWCVYRALRICLRCAAKLFMWYMFINLFIYILQVFASCPAYLLSLPQPLPASCLPQVSPSTSGVETDSYTTSSCSPAAATLLASSVSTHPILCVSGDTCVYMSGGTYVCVG